jgi:hypothetical protein
MDYWKGPDVQLLFLCQNMSSHLSDMAVGWDFIPVALRGGGLQE